MSTFRVRLIDGLRGTHVFAWYARLMELWFSPPRNIRARQMEALARLLRYLRDGHPLYREALRGVRDDDLACDPVGVLRMLPLTDKEILTRTFAENALPVPGRKWQEKHTGGSTGAPFRYRIDLESVSSNWAFCYAIWSRMAGYRPGDPFVTIAGASLDSLAAGLKKKVYHRLQNNHFISGDRLGPELQLPRGLSRVRFIFGYPSAIIYWARTVSGWRERMPSLQAVFTTSEQLLPGMRAEIESGLGVNVFDLYGANDGGIAAGEDEHHDRYYYNALACFAENVSGADGQPEIVLTNLLSYGFPMVRYRVGDVGRVMAPVEAEPGRPGWPYLVDLQGRTRDVLVLPDGRRVHGSLVNQIFFRFPEIAQYQIVQEADGAVRVALRLRQGDLNSPAFVARIRGALAVVLPGLPLSFEPLEAADSGRAKFKVIVSHVS